MGKDPLNVELVTAVKIGLEGNANVIVDLKQILHCVLCRTQLIKRSVVDLEVVSVGNVNAINKQ